MGHVIILNTRQENMTLLQETQEKKCLLGVWIHTSIDTGSGWDEDMKATIIPLVVKIMTRNRIVQKEYDEQALQSS